MGKEHHSGTRQSRFVSLVSTTTTSQTSRKNDGLPTIRGKKVGAHGSKSRQPAPAASSQPQQRRRHAGSSFVSSSDVCSGGPRSWFFAFGVLLAVGVFASRNVQFSDRSKSATNAAVTAVSGLRKNENDKEKETAEKMNTALSKEISAADTTADTVATATAPVLSDPTTKPVPVAATTAPPVAAAAGAAQVAVAVAVVPFTGTVPEKCTVEQMAILSKQLPNSNMCKSKWHPGCSVRVATAQSGCTNPLLARELYASTTDFQVTIDQPFTAVLIVTSPDRLGSLPLDLLSIGSGLDPKYSVPASTSCPPPIVNTNQQIPRTTKAQVVVLDLTPTGSAQAMIRDPVDVVYQQAVNGLDFTKINYGTELLHKVLPSLKEESAAIHYLQIVGSENDYGILMNMIPDLLSTLRFVLFEYNKKGDWYVTNGTTLRSNVALFFNLIRDSLLLFFSSLLFLTLFPCRILGNELYPSPSRKYPDSNKISTYIVSNLSHTRPHTKIQYDIP